jgi:iron complex outermembrane receptor protein
MACLIALAPGTLPAQTNDDASARNLEQLTTLEVSSVARREQQLYKTSSAVFVVTQNDIRHSGAENIPELLRIVPGVQVAQVEGSKWAVSTRGFNSLYANKMLVLIDGRSVYNMIWSATYWDMNEILIDDIERIEVIRGPGATMWGANAVNGVINIITKKPKKTIGAKVVASEGNLYRGASIRYGGQTAQNMQYRVFYKYQKQPALVWANGESANDAGNAMRGGGRVDWQSGANSFSLHGDTHLGREDQQEYSNTPGPISVVQDKSTNSGVYSLLRWEHRGAGSDFALQAYYDYEDRKELQGHVRLSNTDFDFQHHIPFAPRNDLTWGLGARVTHIRSIGPAQPFLHSTDDVDLYSSFAQDEFSVVPNKVVLTAGSKFQWNSYTHFEVQPGLHLLWTPDARHSIWASAARSVRTPSICDLDLKLNVSAPSPLPIPMVLLLMGNPSFKSEDALTYEAGYRQRITKRLSVDLASFFYQYSRLEAQTPEAPYVVASPSPTMMLPLIYTNSYHANSQGFEGALSWTPAHALHFNTSYAWLQAHIALNGGSSSSSTVLQTWSTPRNTIETRGAWDFARHWSVDASVFAVSQTPIRNDATRLPSTAVPAYQRVDASVDYAVGEALVFKAGMRNLQDARHIEFNPQDNNTFPAEVPRSAYIKATWSF